MQRVQGWVENGNVVVTIAGTGYVSSNKVQGSFPLGTVTVYLAGTLTIASIYADNASTAKANPFTASSSGQWFFYAANGTYDIKFSGGGIAAPFTIGAVIVFDPNASYLGTSPLEYGAVGDGVTDDTAAINAAITALSAGGTLNLGCLKYAITSQIAITKRLTILASGQGGFVEKTAITGVQSAGAMVFFNGSNCTASVVQGVNFYGIETNASFLADPGAQTKQYCAVYFSLCDQPHFIDGKISGKRYGVVFDRCTNALSQASNFTGILTGDTATSNYNVGVEQEGGNDHVVSDCTFFHVGNAVLTGTSITGGQTPHRMTISKCQIDTCWNNGIYLSLNFDSVVSECSITNIGVTGNAANAIKMNGSRNSAINNKIETSQVGIGIAGGDAAPDAYNCTGYGDQIIGNTIKNIAWDGISLGTHAGFAFRNLTVIGNYMVSIATDSVNFGLIRGGGYFHYVADNTFEDSRSQYGILMSPDGVHTAVLGMVISRNEFINCAGKGMHLITYQNGVIENNTFQDIAVTPIVLVTTSTTNLIAYNKGISGLANVVVSVDAGSINNVLIKNTGGTPDLSVDETLNSLWLGPRTGSAVPSITGPDRGQLYAVVKTVGDRTFVGRHTGSVNQWEPITDVYIASENGANNAIACSANANLPTLYDGLCVTVKLGHTLRAGTNTFAYNGGAAVSIKSNTDRSADIVNAYGTNSYIRLVYDDANNVWQIVGQRGTNEPVYLAAAGIANAITATGPPLVDGLVLVLQLGVLTLQAGANTFAYNGGGALSIKSHFNRVNDIATAYAQQSRVMLIYCDNIGLWQDAAQ